MNKFGKITTSAAEDSDTLENMYIDVLLKYGLVGSFFFVMVLGQGVIVAIKQLKTDTSVMSNFYIVIMFLLLVNSLSENMNTQRISWVFLALTLAAPYKRDSKQSYRRQ